MTTRELADLVAAAAGVDTVEPWTAEALQAEFGTTSAAATRQRPNRCETRGRATAELGWRPGALSLAQSLLG